MDSDLHSPSNSAGAKAAFHKPLNDPSNRKYRRRSPVSGSSSSDGEPVCERSSTPVRFWDDNAKHNDNRQKKDDRRDIDRDQKRSRYSSRDGGGSNRNLDRKSYNDRRHDDYRRREKYPDEDHKNFRKSSPRTKGASYSDHAKREYEQNRSRDSVDKHSRDRSDGPGHRNRDKYKRDDVRDEKRDYLRTSKDGKSESLPTFEEPRGHRSGHHHKDTSWRDSKELNEKGKSYDQEPRGLKDRHCKEPRELIDDKSILATKKSKFSMDKDTEYIKDANEVESSSLKQVQEFAGKDNVEQDCVKESDIDAAKIAAMKAAELVNRNLIGTGFMSTDQKKKLLWGSKKSTPTEEAAHRWDTSMFSDRERQEKFNKLMSLRLHWYLLWPIVGCQRGRQGGAETREDPKHQSCQKTGRASDGLGEAVHCWPSSQRWPYRRFRPLKIIRQYRYPSQYLLYLCTKDVFYVFKLCYRLNILILIMTLERTYVNRPSNVFLLLHFLLLG